MPIYQESITLEGRGSLTTTGEIEISDRYARGEVIFTNLTDDPITLPQGLIIATLDEPPLRYLTLEDVFLEGQLNYSSTARIQAVTPGIDHNVPSFSISAIEDPQGLNLQVVNLQPIIGGSYITANSPTEDDQRRLFDQILEDLLESALAEISDSLGEEDILLSKTMEVIEIQQESYTPAVGEPSDEISLILRIEFASFVVRGSDLDTLGRQVLQANIPVGYRTIEDTFQVQNLNSPIFTNQTTATWDLMAFWDIVQVLESDGVLDRILGKDPREAKEILQNYYDLEFEPDIQLVPEWWPFLPMVPFNINFTIN